MLRSIVVAAIITAAASMAQVSSMAQAQTAPSSVPACLASLPVATPALPSAHPAGTEQPVKTAAVAKAAIEARGYHEVKHLSQDPVGNWAAEAVHDRMEVALVLQVDGEIEEE